MLTVEAKSDRRAREIATQLGRLGFKVVANENNAQAGLLDLSKNPEALAVQTAKPTVAFSRRGWMEQIEPLIPVGILLLIPGLNVSPANATSAPKVVFGIACVGLFFWDAARMWGWKFEAAPEGIRIGAIFAGPRFPGKKLAP